MPHRPAAARLRTNRQRYPYRYKQSLRGRRKLSFCRPPTGRWSPSEVGDVAANPRIKNCQRKSRKPAECYRLSACELSSTALRKCPYLTTQLPKRAFIAKHLNIGSGAARPATPDTTSSGKALNGDFTNTAHQRSTRPTIAFAQSCGKMQWVLSPRPMRTETLF